MMSYPHEYSRSQLKKVGILLIDEKRGEMRCLVCGIVWRVVKRGLRFPKGYWRCRNGCNNPKASE